MLNRANSTIFRAEFDHSNRNHSNPSQLYCTARCLPLPNARLAEELINFLLKVSGIYSQPQTNDGNILTIFAVMATSWPSLQ